MPYSQSSKSWSSCLPEIRSASAMNSAVVALPLAFSRRPRLEDRKKASSPTVVPAARAGSSRRGCRPTSPNRSALPGSPGGHPPDRRVGLRRSSRRRSAGRLLAAVALGPQPLGVGREALVEPDVLPVVDRDAVAVPLVGQLVHDDPAAVLAGLEERPSCRSAGSGSPARTGSARRR